mmetsp:Transcript_80132/g.223118  ORF Transcript_80132/g.223118 Transcript_80132/m.223118 type:complete len:359 (+) Transcript_80132:1110-2186(+)
MHRRPQPGPSRHRNGWLLTRASPRSLRPARRDSESSGRHLFRLRCRSARTTNPLLPHRRQPRPWPISQTTLYPQDLATPCTPSSLDTRYPDESQLPSPRALPPSRTCALFSWCASFPCGLPPPRSPPPSSAQRRGQNANAAREVHPRPNESEQGPEPVEVGAASSERVATTERAPESLASRSPPRTGKDLQPRWCCGPLYRRRHLCQSTYWGAATVVLLGKRSLARQTPMPNATTAAPLVERELHQTGRSRRQQLLRTPRVTRCHRSNSPPTPSLPEAHARERRQFQQSRAASEPLHRRRNRSLLRHAWTGIFPRLTGDLGGRPGLTAHQRVCSTSPRSATPIRRFQHLARCQRSPGR